MTNIGQLAMRDPAKAALLGIIPGGNFGHESPRRRQAPAVSSYPAYAMAGSDFGGEMGAEFGDDYGFDYTQTVGAEFGAEFGGYYNYGADPAPAHAPPHRAAPHHPAIHPQHAAILAKHSHAQKRTQMRELLLEPNKGSQTKVERYDFSINQALTLGTALAGFVMSLQPSVTLRPQRLITNAPSPMFVVFTSISVANVQVTVGSSTDAFSYSAGAFMSHLDCPTLSPANRASLLGNYTGLTPTGFAPATAVTFVATFQGPATIVA